MPIILSFNIKVLQMITKMNSNISEINSHNSEFRNNRSDILDHCETYLGVLEHLIQKETLEDSLNALFQYLCDLMPLTYLFYTPPYESQESDHIYISKEGIRFFKNIKTPTRTQINRIFEHRARFSTDKIFYIKSSKEMDTFFSIITSQVKIESPCLYFYFLYNGQVQGSIYFGCSGENEFSREDRLFLEKLWQPLYFIIRFHYQQRRLEKILELTQENNRALRKQVSGFSTDIVGANSGLRDVAREIRLLAPFDIPVLLTGETGTGKDLFASELHRLSPRNDKPFVAINCGGIAPTLLDSELFGYTKGAFTGAFKDYKGRFERAQGGTIFLDEIGELPLDAQTRLLRVIQNHTVERLGGSAPIPVDFRIVCATNKNLKDMVQQGTFREDLYFRLAGVTVRIPSLRERPGDIPLLVQRILHKEAVRYGVPVPVLAAGEMHKLLNYSWPGNVRELINVVTEGFVRGLQNGVVIFRTGKETASPNWQDRKTMPTFADLQREYFTRLLQMCEGCISGPRGAAVLAGIKPNTLRAKLDKLNIPYGRQGKYDSPSCETPENEDTDRNIKAPSKAFIGKEETEESPAPADPALSLTALVPPSTKKRADAS